LLHSDHVVASARLNELDRQRAVFFEERGRTVWIRDHRASGAVGRDRVAAPNHLLDQDLSRKDAALGDRDAIGERVEEG